LSSVTLKFKLIGYFTLIFAVFNILIYYYSFLMAKTHGFHKVVRASAVTPRKRQISKVVTIPVADHGILRPIIVLPEALPHTKALTSVHRRRGT
jgi:hypothetical protein